ncbi:MAG: hypothetical protein ACKPKO_07505 [Candidatus Fonsibacter sp.]
MGQASATSSGIEMAASGETTIDFSTPGINYKMTNTIQQHD